MFFYLERAFAQPKTVEVILDEGHDRPAFIRPNALFLNKGKQQLISFETGNKSRLILMGDPVVSGRSILGEDGLPDENRLFEQIKGHYYWFWLTPDGLRCGSSFGAIFPVYYHKTPDGIALCSSSVFLASRTGAEPGDKRNLLERLLFNYPFFGSTWWHGIGLLEAHRHIHLSGNRAETEGHFALERYFGAPEDTSRDSLAQLAELFQEECRAFFPKEPFAVSLTGGFDGRTLAAAARKAGKSFFTYSFGRPGAPDVATPEKQSRRLGIPYHPVTLDEQYLDRHALDSAEDFMRLTEYNGNLGRPHYRYAAEALSEKTRYIATGNFGSELFRALHIPGVMMSRPLIDVFSAPDDSWKDILRAEAAIWGRDTFAEETDALIADLEAYLRQSEGMDPNHRFYIFVFGEIFRKYFGPELIMQSHFLNNRTPYLNLHFFKALNQTIWSGVHSRLFEKMKSKRMKGQLFYATFLRHADRLLYTLPTTKGYSPADVYEPWRMPMLAGGVLTRKYLKKEFADDNAVDAFFSRYHRAISGEWNAAEMPSPEIRAMLAGAPSEISGGKYFEKWIKLYSILYGWHAVCHQPAEEIPVR